MPTIFEYLGIIIKFYSNEHEPIHIHAVYNDSSVKVSFFIKEGKIYRTSYLAEFGTFPTTKMKQLKKFISVYKEDIIESWLDYFIWKEKIIAKKITKKL